MLKIRIDSIRKAYQTNLLPDGQSFNGINDGRSKLTDQLGLYPNPAGSSVTIDFRKLITETVQIRVINSNGKSVLSYEMNPESSKAMLNVASLPNGMYIVTVRSKGFNAAEKLSVSR